MDSHSTTEDSEEAQARRRQQVYQAQRNRKAEYLQSLEAEIIRLQHDDAQTAAEKAALARENAELKALLQACSTDDTASLTAQSRKLAGDGGSSSEVAIRFDPIVQAERTFVAFPPAVPSISICPSQPDRSAEPDSWVALDFILALEYVCRDHIRHAALSPDAEIPVACELTGVNGHALTTTSAVLAGAQATARECDESCDHSHGLPRLGELRGDVREKWRIPYVEVEKLVSLSEKLEMDEELLTPAQAYGAVRRALPMGRALAPVLERLKGLLAKAVECRGLGTVLRTDVFREHLSSVLKETS